MKINYDGEYMTESLKELKEKNERLRQIIDEKDKQQHEVETKTNIYHGIRFVQMICIGLAVFGALWKGTEVLNLDTPSFLMVYGCLGAVISEVIARIFKKKITK